MPQYLKRASKRPQWFYGFVLKKKERRITDDITSLVNDVFFSRNGVWFNMNCRSTDSFTLILCVCDCREKREQMVMILSCQTDLVLKLTLSKDWSADHRSKMTQHSIFRYNQITPGETISPVSFQLERNGVSIVTDNGLCLELKLIVLIVSPYLLFSRSKWVYGHQMNVRSTKENVFLNTRHRAVSIQRPLTKQ